jgi:hypothetical protein
LEEPPTAGLTFVLAKVSKTVSFAKLAYWKGLLKMKLSHKVMQLNISRLAQTVAQDGLTSKPRPI